MAVHNTSIPTTSLPIGSTEATVTVPGYGGPKKRTPEPQCYGLVEDAKSIDDLITLASIIGDPIPDFKNLDFQVANWTQKDPDRKLQETSHRSRRHSSICEEITYRHPDCLDDLRRVQTWWRPCSHLGLQRVIERPIKERKRSSLRHTVGRSITSSH